MSRTRLKEGAPIKSLPALLRALDREPSIWAAAAGPQAAGNGGPVPVRAPVIAFPLNH